MRYEACFDCGDDDRLPCWEVIEWTFDDGRGNRMGGAVADYGDDRAGAELHASILNTAADVDAFFNQECEFDR